MTGSRGKEIAIVLMASGFGKRYGKNKLLEPWQGRPLFTYGLHRALESRADPICVVTCFPAIREYVRRLPSAKRLQVVWNAHPERGISESIRLGVRRVRESEGCCFMVCDQPLLSAETLRRMFAAFDRHPDAICVCSAQGRRGNPVLFPGDLYGELLELRGDQGGRQILRRYPQRIREIPAARQEELWDVDTETDLAILAEKAYDIVKTRQDKGKI